MNLKDLKGSTKGKLNKDDFVASGRDSFLAAVAAIVVFQLGKYGLMDAEIKVAVDVVVFFSLKLAWKYFTDTRRLSRI